MKEWFIGGICAVVIMAACAIPWGRIGGSTTVSSSPSPEGTPPSAPSRAPTPPPGIDPEKKIQELVERTKGDSTKLTPDEVGHLNSFTNGHGLDYFRERRRQWKEKMKHSRPSDAPSPKGTAKDGTPP